MRRLSLRSAPGAFAAGLVTATVLGIVALAPLPAATAAGRTRVNPGASRTAGPGRALGPRLPADERQPCPRSAQPGVMACQALVLVPSPAERAAAARAARAGRGPVLLGYSPLALRSAYRLVSAAVHRGTGATIAVVDAHSDPRLASDLAVYRRQFRLPACTTASGCLRILNQHGAPSPLPSPSLGWGIEESIDVEMVSAICPSCHIVVVEAKNEEITNLAGAEMTAAATGARFISNSWDGAEFTDQAVFDQDFNHPGDAVVVAAGDYGYAALYPATNPFVTAVGGTTLTRDRKVKRGWSERAWGGAGSGSRFGNLFNPGTGSGCSILEPKPTWQLTKPDDSAAGCLNRTVADVAAVADPATGVSVYDSFGTRDNGGPWLDIGGTSVATPIIAATYALAGTPEAGTYPASYPYRRPAGLFDVTAGTNGTCEPSRQYLCNAERGYDGPTGLGTPDGTGAFAAAGPPPVTLVDPGTQDLAAGGSLRMTIVGLDARTSAASLAYSAAGLPAGLSIQSVAASTSALISGSLPAAPGTWPVTVSARDTVTGQSGSVHFMIVSAGSLTRTGSGPGHLGLHDVGLCLDVSPAGQVLVEDCAPVSAQAWVYTSAGAPGGPGALSNGSACLLRAGRQVTVAACQPGSAAQQWTPAGYGMLRNGLGGCLAAAAQAAAEPAGIVPCTRKAIMRWTLPAGLLVSGESGECASSQGGVSGLNTLVTAQPCDAGSGEQRMALHADLSIQTGSDCLDVPGPTLVGSALDGVNVQPNFCVEEFVLSQQWLTGPSGELINNYSGKCLDDPAPGTGTPLVQEDCYGEAGEIWADN